jgi:hypothetical protein
MNRTLILILVAVALIVGSFIWFVVTWNPKAEESITALPAQVMQS